MMWAPKRSWPALFQVNMVQAELDQCFWSDAFVLGTSLLLSLGNPLYFLHIWA